MTNWLWAQTSLALAGGLLGSSHCLGMCGPFALMIGSGATCWQSNLGRQLLYSLGRIFTYAVLGAAAGYGGMRLAGSAGGPWRAAPVALSIVAGLLLVRQGMMSLGWAHPVGGGGACLSGSILSGLLRDKRRVSVFLAGLFTGFLPCGLVYGFLALAAATSSWLAGMVMMTAFGVGTAPVMMAAGAAGGLLQGASRQRLFRAAAWSVLVAGCVTVVRGAVFAAALLQPSGGDSGCPFCLEADVVAQPATKESS